MLCKEFQKWYHWCWSWIHHIQYSSVDQIRTLVLFLTAKLRSLLCGKKHYCCIEILALSRTQASFHHKRIYKTNVCCILNVTKQKTTWHDYSFSLVEVHIGNTSTWVRQNNSFLSQPIAIKSLTASSMSSSTCSSASSISVTVIGLLSGRGCGCSPSQNRDKDIYF